MFLERVPRQLFRVGLSLHLAVLVLTLFPAMVRATPITMVNNGPSSNRVDVVFLGDGYTAADLNTSYVTHINSMVNYMFSSGQDPYPRYSKFFNIHRVNITSNERGADVPPSNIFRNTALDSTYFFDGITDRLLYINGSKANSALATGLSGASFGAEVRLVTVNDARYGGGGAFGGYGVYAGAHRDATEIALHELGHSFNFLADEYGGNPTKYPGSEPQQRECDGGPQGDKVGTLVGLLRTALWED